MNKINWISLTSSAQLSELKATSHQIPQLIFKHSTRCGISSMALSRLEREEAPSGVDCYLLDLISHRDISAEIADTFHVHHESPQILLIVNGECIYDESHIAISMDEIKEQLLQNK